MLVERILSLTSKIETPRRIERRITASIISPCKRCNVYLLRDLSTSKTEERMDKQMLMRFHDGLLHHDDIIDLLKKSGCKILGKEVEVRCGPIIAHIDAVVDPPPFGEPVNVEIKTMSSSSFKHFISNGLQGFLQYYYQCQVIAGSEPKRRLFLIVKNKDTGHLVEEEIKEDRELIEKLKTSYVEISEDLEKLPDREFEYSSDVCQSCYYFFKCWFPSIRKSITLKSDLDPKEYLTIKRFLAAMSKHLYSYEKYLFLLNSLRNYIALLHVRHRTERIDLDELSSSLVEKSLEKVNKVYLRQILTREQLSEAIEISTSKHYRLTLRKLK